MNWQKLATDLAALARPVRMFVWTFLLVGIVAYILFTGGKTDNTGLMMVIVTGIFADLGVNALLRTNEKNVVVKTEGNQKAVETITEPNTNTNIENINLSNDVVNMPSKEKVNNSIG